MTRPVCARCRRPQRACICRWITPTDNAVEVLLLQHPEEAGNAKNSAGLLHLSLARSRLEVGECFDETALRQLLLGGRKPCLPVLLYPPATDVDGAAAAPLPPQMRTPGTHAPLLLVILDATWRKSRKMLHQNPLLRTLPRLSLDDAPASRYLIRRAHRAHQLSTLEAACYALMQLEETQDRYAPLLQAFDGFVGQQLAFRRHESDADNSDDDVSTAQ